MAFNSDWTLLGNGVYRNEITSQSGCGVLLVFGDGHEETFMLTKAPPAIKFNNHAFVRCADLRTDCIVYRELDKVVIKAITAVATVCKRRGGI